jgi:hypothetical protein
MKLNPQGEPRQLDYLITYHTPKCVGKKMAVNPDKPLFSIDGIGAIFVHIFKYICTHIQGR